MQRLCTKLRSISSHSNRSLSFIGGAAPPHRRLIHHHSPSSQLTLGFATPSKWSFLPAASSSLGGGVSPCSMGSAFLPHHFVQVRNITSKDKMAKWKKKWRPRTPITSKVKKVKIKFYSSYKDRFRPLNDGTIRRWKEGKRHNAHLKSKKSKRRLRQPGLVPPAYAKVMKKLNFCN
ncbi:Ribosomal protein L35 [Hirschfeldia incana]|nr:Ribosomal protein L35 [Hirschfeldia incana]